MSEDLKSVECFFSITPLPEAEGLEGDAIGRRDHDRKNSRARRVVPVRRDVIDSNHVSGDGHVSEVIVIVAQRRRPGAHTLPLFGST